MDATERRRRATEEATQWWSRIGGCDPAEISTADREQFTAWLRESPLHVAEMLHVAHVHDTLKRFAHWKEIVADPGPQEESVVPLSIGDGRLSARRPQRARLRAWAAAAVIACIAVIGAWLAKNWEVQTIATARAERREVMLNDGSIVQLEPQTRLEVRFGDRQRSVLLSRGRALFHVAKDAARPFIVTADGTAVRAVGTAFGVERKDSGIIVTVSEGKVAVMPVSGKSRGATESASSVARSLLLTAGKQVTVPRSGSARAVEEVDTSRALAWAEGRLVFDSAPLSEVAEEFNRYNHVQLHIRGEELARRPVSGVFKASDPDTFIAFIGAGARVTVMHDGSQDIVIAPASE